MLHLMFKLSMTSRVSLFLSLKVDEEALYFFLLWITAFEAIGFTIIVFGVLHL